MQPYHSLTEEGSAIDRSALNQNAMSFFFSLDFLTIDKQDTLCMQSITFAGPFDSVRLILTFHPRLKAILKACRILTTHLHKVKQSRDLVRLSTTL